MRRILLLSGNVSAADRERCHAFVDFLRRRARFDPEGAPEPEAALDQDTLAEALLRLAGRGLLSYTAAADGSMEVFYTPSREALQSVLEAGPEAGFPDAVQKKQAAAFRTSQGALLRFPLEQGEGAVEVFITDWSPCPAACAVAIHRAHPLAADLEKPEGPWFTGRYVRHPLTGDLLPVWVADWVRPDFGTGAVLVNPAHDATDLSFGRAIGLPIRFALVPSSDDGSPATWPDPPVVKTGQTIRTGPWDGRSVEEAAGVYFEVMAARGLAVRHRDVQAGRWKIARLVPDPAGNLAWSAPRWTVLPPAAGGGSGAHCADAGLLAAALSAAGSRPLLVCPAGEQAGELLALRLLVNDLAGRPLTPSAVFLVQKVQESKVEAPAEVVRLAALVGSPVQQVAVIKQQTVEQVQRFLRVHQELLAQAAEAGGTVAAGDGEHPALRAFAKIKAAVDEADPAKAFTLLQQTQKQLRDLPAEGRAGALPGYFDLAEAVAGLERPSGLGAS
jgi:leucyl-tRNA synthetase